MTKTRVSDSRDLAPCGHTREQAAWLGCVGRDCRVGDVEISDAYYAKREYDAARATQPTRRY